MLFIFFLKQKTAYEVRISDWSSDVCSSDLVTVPAGFATFVGPHHIHSAPVVKTVAFGPATVTITDLTDPLTYLGVDVNGNIVQIDGVPSRVQRRQYAILGRAEIGRAHV